jgi:hypothetical protein
MRHSFQFELKILQALAELLVFEFHLDSNSVPNVLWGNYLLTIFGVPSIVAVRYAFPPCLVESADLSLGCRVCRARF